MSLIALKVDVDTLRGTHEEVLALVKPFTRHPFVPVHDTGIVLGPAQFPTTLPTLDELIGNKGISAENVHTHLLSLTDNITRDQVYTLHAELEGIKLLPVLERLIDGWSTQGHSLVDLGELRDSAPAEALPLNRIAIGRVPGRDGLLAVQGHAWHEQT